MALPWPGNVRELENFLARTVVFAEGETLRERELFVGDNSASGVALPAPVQLEAGLPLREVEHLAYFAKSSRQ